MTAALTPDNTPQKDKSSLLNLDDLLTEIAQKVTGSSINLPAHFNFFWHSIHFSGQVLPSQDKDNFTLNLVANLGYIPFSAENKARRKALIDTFMPLFLRGEYQLSISSQIQMILFTECSGNVTARRLIEAITLTLLDFQQDFKSVQKSVTNP